jgi:hypothetical protein
MFINNKLFKTLAEYVKKNILHAPKNNEEVDNFVNAVLKIVFDSSKSRSSIMKYLYS